jgi:ASCH domain
MKALSIKQPWAWLIVNGHKDIENRDWRSDNPGLKYRGGVLIHTGLRMDEDWSAFGMPEICRHVPADEDLPRGGIVGICEIVNCVKEHPSPWFFGRYGFVLRNARTLEFRPCVGQLGFFEPNFNLKYAEKPAKHPRKDRIIRPKAVPMETMLLFKE